jgi:hypothetical protein
MPGDVNRGPILNNDALERSHKRKTNLFKELITELRIGNREILEELPLERMMPGLGHNPHDTFLPHHWRPPQSLAASDNE